MVKKFLNLPGNLTIEVQGKWPSRSTIWSNRVLYLTKWLNYLLQGPYIEDITCPRVDMNFIFEYWTQYLTSESGERVRYRVEHENINFISTSGHLIFCLLYKHTNDNFFDEFPEISEHFAKISEDSWKVAR